MESATLHELRIESRSNIFVMAALYSAGRTVTPVRVRNISTAGALIEAAVLPPPGTNVRLGRASLSATGTLVWVENAKAGMRFDEPVAVADWLPQGRRGFGQQFVDELFHQKRLGAAKVALSGGADVTASLADEILGLRTCLERAAEELALDGAVASRHLTTLQAIDSVSQALAKLAAEMALQGTSLVTGTAR
jgi:hypothetical protein